MTEFEIGVLGWLGVTTVGLLLTWTRVEVKLAHVCKSLDRLWKEFDDLHPRRANPGHRVGVNHGHEREE